MQYDPALDAELIASFYDAAAEPALWPEAWARLCTAFEADTGLVYRQAHVSDGLARAVAEWPPVPLRAFDDGLLHLDPFAVPGRLGEAFGALLGVLVPAPRQFGASDAYLDFARRHIGGAHHVLGAGMVLEGFASAGIALHRPKDAEPFDVPDGRSLASLAHHLAAALRLERVLAEQRVAQAARESVLDQLAHGAVIAAADGRILFANRAAMAIAAGGGIELAGPAGIRPADPAQADAMAKLLRDAARGRSGGSLRLHRPRGAAIAVSVGPLQSPIASSAAGLALVALRDLAASPEVSSPQLMALFDLTAAEASIVPQLLAGETAHAIAQSRGVKVATVRDQAARILVKTGAPNLRALATMIAALS